MMPAIDAPDILFDGTVVHGELVPVHGGGYAFIIYDCMMSCGVPCSEYNYLIRLQIAGLLNRDMGT